MKSLRRHPLAPAVPFVILVLIAIFEPIFVPYPPEKVVANALLAPSWSHWFGTDATGMDVFSRTMAATRIDLLIAFLCALIATVVGVAIGLVIGLNESKTGLLGSFSRGATRVVDFSDAVPALIIGIVAIGLYGPSVFSLTLALTFHATPNQARLTRAEVLKVRGDAYLDAARMSGQRPAQIMIRHVLPNSCRPALANSSYVFGVALIVGSALGFLGIGLQPPTPEWGAMISSGLSDVVTGRWWTTVFPSVALCIAVACAAGVTTTLTRMTRGGAVSSLRLRRVGRARVRPTEPQPVFPAVPINVNFPIPEESPR